MNRFGLFALVSLGLVASAAADPAGLTHGIDPTGTSRRTQILDLTNPASKQWVPTGTLDATTHTWWPYLGSTAVTTKTGTGSTVVLNNAPTFGGTVTNSATSAGDAFAALNSATGASTLMRHPDGSSIGAFGTWTGSAWGSTYGRGAWTFDTPPTWASGQLGVAYGGTGTNSATGTGATVRAHSPTFGGSVVSSATSSGDAFSALNSATSVFTTIRHPDGTGKGAVGAWNGSSWNGMYGRGAWAFDTAPTFPTPGLSAGATTAATLGIVNASQCYDVRRSGVVWDGTTNDSSNFLAAVVAALAETGNGGACVALPKGTGVLCDITLPVFSQGLRIVGAGMGATQVKLCSTTANLFSTTNSSLNRNFEASHFSVIPAGTQTAGTYFLIDSTFNVLIHDIYSPGGFNFAKLGPFNGNNNVIVTKTLTRNFKNVVFEFNKGYDLWFWANGYDSDCARTDSACQPYAFFIVREFGGVMLESNDAIHCGTCYLFEPLTSGTEITWIFIKNGQADTCSGHGYYFHAASGTKIKGVNALQLWSSSCAGDGIRINEESGGLIGDINFVQPILLGNDGHGIYAQRLTQAMSITAPQIGGNSASNSGTNSGIYLEAGSGRATIVGGTVGAQAGNTETQKYGVAAAAGATIETRIIGTNVCGNVTGAISNGMTADKFIVSGAACVFRGPTTVSVGASPYTYTPTIASQQINIFGGTVSSVTVAGTQVCSSSPCSTRAAPGEAVVVTYSSTPTMISRRD